VSLPTAAFRDSFDKVGGQFLWDPRLLEAQAMVESSGLPRAFRYEPAKQDASFGLMQVLGTTARRLGLPSTQAEASLCDAAVGIEYGMKALMDIVHWVGGECAQDRAGGAYKTLSLPLPAHVRTVLARYNGGGVGNPGADGSLRNEDYVKRVETHFAAVLADGG